jgi:hypothetical protein
MGLTLTEKAGAFFDFYSVLHSSNYLTFLLCFYRLFHQVIPGDHATAVSSDRHLIQCIAYIDLNMVRAGVVNHPSEWNFGGYNEIQKPRERYALIDYKRLMELVAHLNS